MPLATTKPPRPRQARQANPSAFGRRSRTRKQQETTAPINATAKAVVTASVTPITTPSTTHPRPAPRRSAAYNAPTRAGNRVNASVMHTPLKRKGIAAMT
jgi:hypothetical protein